MRYLTSFTLVLLLFWGLLLSDGNGQFSIDSTVFSQKIGTSISQEHHQTFNMDSVQPILDATGENQTYDFTNLSGFEFKGTITVEVTDGSQPYPGSDRDAYSGTNFAMKMSFTLSDSDQDSTAWTYQKLTTNSLFKKGGVFKSQSDLNNDGVTPDTVFLHYDPQTKGYAFPLHYDTSWQESYERVFNLTGSPYSQRADVSKESMVTGYGTLKLPDQTLQCLRLEIEKTISYTNKTVTKKSWVFISENGIQRASIYRLNGELEMIYYRTEPEATNIDDRKSSAPETFNLHQNYPNPFNPNTKITYELKQTVPVRLTVYNMQGQQITTLVDQRQNRGSHTVTFQGDNLASGLYFYRLEAGPFTSTRKMVLVK